MPIPGNLLTTAMAVMLHTDVDQALKTALSMDIPFQPQLPNLNLYRKTEFWIEYTLLSLHITYEFVTTHVVRLKLFRLKAKGVRKARLP